MMIEAATPASRCRLITEGIPTQDMVKVGGRSRRKTRIIGPNCPGMIHGGRVRPAGITPNNITHKGPIGLVSKSVPAMSTTTNSAIWVLDRDRDRGESDHRHDPHRRAPRVPQTAPGVSKAIVMIGEIGGDAEERAARLHRRQRHEAGRRLRRRFHRAGGGRRWATRARSCRGSAGTAQAKKGALEAAGVKVGRTPSETADLMRAVIAGL